MLASAGHGGETRIPVIEGFTVRIGLTSSVVTIADGCATALVPGLVSALWEEMDWVWGAMDVAFLGDDLYVLISGAGPSWLSPTAHSGVFRLNDDGTMTLVADLTFGLDGKLYAAEVSTGNPGSAPYFYPDTGRIVRQSGPDSLEFVAAGLNEPVGLGFDADGALYVSGPASGATNGEGWLARVDMARNAAVPGAAATADCAAMATPTT